MRRPTAATIVAAVLLVGAAGCGGGTADDVGSPGGSTPAGPATGEGDVIIEAGDPKAGGVLAVGLGAETDGWDPTANRWGVDGTLVGMAIFDPLTALDADANAKPYLARTITPNADFTVWTIALRPDVTFHDGTPLTAEAVRRTLDAHLASVLTAKSIDTISSMAVVDPTTLELTMSRPWATFPATLAGQVGVVPAPSMLDDPAGFENPVGTGPFAFASWATGSELEVVRNDSYWRTDERGEPLPYLDGIDFTPIPDPQAQLNALAAGTIDFLRASDPTQIAPLRQRAADGAVQLRADTSNQSKSFVMLNLAAAPFDDPIARKAVVLATDPDRYNDITNDGLLDTADSLYPEWSKWNNPAASDAWPGYDLDAAKVAVGEYEAAHGEPLRFTLSVSSGPSLSGAQLLQSQYAEAGIAVEIAVIDPTAFILKVVQGDYQAMAFAYFSASDPDGDAVWMLSKNAADPPQISLNFARLRDPAVDEALEAGRASADPEVRTQAYADLEQRLNELQPYVWLANNQVVVVAANDVHHFWNGTLPDGEDALPIADGIIRFTQVWKDS